MTHRGRHARDRGGIRPEPQPRVCLEKIEAHWNCCSTCTSSARRSHQAGARRNVFHLTSLGQVRNDLKPAPTAGPADSACCQLTHDPPTCATRAAWLRDHAVEQRQTQCLPRWLSFFATFAYGVESLIDVTSARAGTAKLGSMNQTSGMKSNPLATRHHRSLTAEGFGSPSNSMNSDLLMPPARQSRTFPCGPITIVTGGPPIS